MDGGRFGRPPPSGLRPEGGSGPIARQRRRATEPPAASRPFRLRSLPRELAARDGVALQRRSGCQVVQGCLHASEIVQNDRVGLTNGDVLVDGRSDRPGAHCTRAVAFARSGRDGLTVPGRARQSGPLSGSSRVHGCPISLRESEDVRSQGIETDSPTESHSRPLLRARASVRRPPRKVAP
jgi:hypothetical protein